MRFWIATLCLGTSLYGDFTADELKMHALYSMQNKDIEMSLSRYEQYCAKAGKHDFETLQQMGLIMLQKGIETDQPATYLMTLFGAGISGCTEALNILEKGLEQPDPQIQLLSLHFIAQFEDDRTYQLLNKAMSSDFLSTRMEAAFHMAQRKHPHAVGQIEGLMLRLPPVFKPYFPSFFALMGTSDATIILKRLLEDPDPQVRIESILNIAKLGRDDFLPSIRRRLTHSHIAEVEASIFAVGALKDGSSVAKLKILCHSPTESIRLAAAMALLSMGDRTALPVVEDLASHHYLFAISALGLISDTEELLVELVQSSDLQVRLNATLGLLQRHDPRCLPSLYEILIQDSRGLAFQPVGTLGRTLSAFKVIPSAELREKDPTVDLSFSASLREHFFREAIHLPEDSFLTLCKMVFKSQQNDLVPTAISLLENLRTDKAIALLKEGSEKITAPLIRDYCHLSLYRLKVDGVHEEYVNHWVLQQKTADLIRLKPLLPWKYRMEQTNYTLSAEERSKLLIDSFLSIANRRDERSISLFLNAMKQAKEENRFALMGLLMRATE